MKSAFPGQFSNNAENIKSLWDEAIIALDANVLLDLYRYSDSTRAALFNVLELMKDRVWISNQVASEYFANRLGVICDQAKHYEDAIRNLEKLKAGFENQKQHPFVVVETLNGFVESFDKVVAELKESKDGHERRVSNDEIKEQLGVLFDGRVGGRYDEESLEKIILEGAERYKSKVPPGFKDAKKSVGETLKERCVPYGDYIGWLQLIDYSKEKKCGVIYVTGDVKEDWWLRHQGKTIGPLPELVEEFVDKTSYSFYMYQPDRFLEFANKFLKQDASPEAVEEIREVAISDFYDDGSGKVSRWFTEHGVGKGSRFGFWTDLVSGMGPLESIREHADFRALDLWAKDGVIRSGHGADRAKIRAFSEGLVEETEEDYIRNKINALQWEKTHLKARQAKQVDLLNNLSVNVSGVEFEEKAQFLSEKINSISQQIKVINEDLRGFRVALESISRSGPDGE